MSREEKSPISTEEFLAICGTWFNRIGLAISVFLAVGAAIAQVWVLCVIGVLGIAGYIYNRYAFRRMESHSRRSS